MTLVNRHEELLVAERAAEWIERLKTGGPEERTAFVNWLKESRRHVREILLATTWDTLLVYLDPQQQVDIEELTLSSSANILHVSVGDRAQGTLGKVAPPRRSVRWPWLAGISATACALALLAMVSPELATSWLPLGNKFTTAIGEQRAIELADGSIVHLNTRSQVKVNFSGETRDIYLSKGQAIFKVRHDPTRPFRVHAGETVVQALGTQFDVHRLADRIEVAVIDGVVQVTPGGRERRGEPPTAPLHERARLAAGEAISIVAGELTPPALVNVTEINAWQQRRLIFRGNTLAEIAAEFNRYNKAPQIRIEGEVLQEKRFSGVFDADDPETLLLYLGSDRNLTIDRAGDLVLVRGHPGLTQAWEARGTKARQRSD